MSKVVDTNSIISGAMYYSNVSEFFDAFDEPWENVRGQILKLETRQTYIEAGNPSYEAFVEGNWSLSMELLPKLRAEDDEAYLELHDKKVDFTRCRLIECPLSDYLKWEVECYKLNEQKGERIYFFENDNANNHGLSHDFMVFDRSIALIHDYDQSGEIRGGWAVNDKVSIDNLIMLFSLFKASSVYFSQYLKINECRI